MYGRAMGIEMINSLDRPLFVHKLDKLRRCAAAAVAALPSTRQPAKTSIQIFPHQPLAKSYTPESPTKSRTEGYTTQAASENTIEDYNRRIEWRNCCSMCKSDSENSPRNNCSIAGVNDPICEATVLSLSHTHTLAVSQLKHKTPCSYKFTNTSEFSHCSLYRQTEKAIKWVLTGYVVAQRVASYVAGEFECVNVSTIYTYEYS